MKDFPPHRAALVGDPPPVRADLAYGPSLTLIVLVLLWAAVSGLHSLWLSLNTVPPHWDAAYHMMSALKYRTVLSECVNQAVLSIQSVKHCIGEIIYVDQFVYPPLFPLAGGLFSFAAGTSITALALTNLPFVAALVAAMYVMGSTLHSRVAGVLAAVLILAYPLVFQTSREFMLEFAMLAVTAAAGAFLIQSDRFRKTGPTLLFGLTIGLGALTKFTFLVYLAGPAIYVFGRLMTDAARHHLETRETVRRLLTLACGLLAGGIVAAAWYWPHRVGFLEALRDCGRARSSWSTAAVSGIVDVLPEGGDRRADGAAAVPDLRVGGLALVLPARP